MSSPRIVLGLLLTVFWLPLAAVAQESAVELPVEREKLDAIIAELEDPERRAALIDRLRVLAEGMEAPPEETAGVHTATGDLMRALSVRVASFTDRTLAVASRLEELPSQRAALWAAATDPAFVPGLVTGLLQLLAIVGPAYLALLLATVAVRRAQRAGRSYNGTGIFARCLWLLANFALELLPVVAFAAAGYLLLALVDTSETVRLLALAWVNAALLLRLLLATTRLLTSPAAPGLRLLDASDANAHAVDAWIRRLLIVSVYGYFGLQAAVLLGLGSQLYHALADLLGLLVIVMLASALFSHRHTVSGLIRGPAASAEGTAQAVAGLRQGLARLWPLLAGLYLAGIFGVWVLEVPGGALYLLRASIVSLLILVLLHAVRSAAGRLFSLWLDRSSGRSGFAARLTRFAPLLRTLARSMLYLAAALGLLATWGVDAFGWVASDTGRTFSASLVRILAILFVAGLIWELSAFLLERWLAESDHHGRPRERSARAKTLLTVARNALLVLITIVTTLMILPELGVNIAPLLAGAGVLGLAVGFGAQRLVQDVITGVFILLQDLMAVGEVVKLGDRVGLVEAISVRTVRLRDLSGTVHTIPFSAIDTVSNLTKDFSFHVFDLGVAYREDVDEVMRLIHEVGAELRQDPEIGPLILQDVEIFGVDAFGDSAVVIKGRIKTLPIKQWPVGRAFNRRIKMRFDEAGVEIPFPHRTLYFGEDKTGRAPAMRLQSEAATGDVVQELHANGGSKSA